MKFLLAFARTMRIRLLLLSITLALLGTINVHAEIPIGWIGPLTGNAATLGVDTIPAIQIAVDEINAAGGIRGEKLTLIAEDDQYNTSKTISAYNNLVHNRGVRVLFVLTYGGLFTLAERAQRDGVILIDTLDADEDTAKLPSNTFCIAKTTEGMGTKLAHIISEGGEFPLGVIYFDGDPFMGTLSKSLLSELASLGRKAEMVETYNDTTTDFRSLATRMKSRSIRSVALLGYDQLGLAARTIRDFGIQARLYGVSVVTSPGFRKLAGDAADGIIGVAFKAPRGAELEAFQRTFVARVGRVWQFETSTIPSYDAMKLLGVALSSPRSLRKGANSKTEVVTDSVREALLETRGYKGLSGNITIDPDGITRSIEVSPVVYRNGRAEILQER